MSEQMASGNQRKPTETNGSERLAANMAFDGPLQGEEGRGMSRSHSLKTPHGGSADHGASPTYPTHPLAVGVGAWCPTQPLSRSELLVVSVGVGARCPTQPALLLLCTLLTSALCCTSAALHFAASLRFAALHFCRSVLLAALHFRSALCCSAHGGGHWCSIDFH